MVCTVHLKTIGIQEDFLSIRETPRAFLFCSQSFRLKVYCLCTRFRNPFSSMCYNPDTSSQGDRRGLVHQNSQVVLVSTERSSSM